MAHPQLYRITRHDYADNMLEVVYTFGHDPGHRRAESMAADMYQNKHRGYVSMELYQHNRWIVFSKIKIREEDFSCVE